MKINKVILSYLSHGIICYLTDSFLGIAVSSVSWLPYVLAVLGIFTTVTMWAVVVTEGCRKVKLQYYGFKLASAAR